MITRHAFKIEGPLLGYRASVRRAFDPKYKAFKRAIRAIANTAGVPDELRSSDHAEVFVKVFWKRKARIDGSNVYKAVEDGLWAQDRGVVAGHFVRFADSGEEYAEVEVTVEREADA